MNGAVQLRCGKCGREIKGERTWCVYCGWSGDDSGPSHLPEIQAERFRASGTLWPFVFSALILGSFALILGHHAAFVSRGGADQLSAIALCALFTLLGPFACALQLMRHRLRWVEVEPEHGLLLRHEQRISWQEIESVESRVGPFARRHSLTSLAERLPGGMAGLKLGFVVLPLLVVYYVFLPAISVFSPWHSRVVIRLRNGDEIRLRDLENAERFLRFVHSKIDLRQNLGGSRILSLRQEG